MNKHRRVDQEFQERTDAMAGDCVRASVATLLALPIEEVPHFVQVAGDNWRPELGAWLSRIGMCCVEVPDSEVFYTYPIGAGAFCMALGDGPRGHRHAVVWDIENSSMLHDPHKSRAGLVGRPHSFVFLMSRDPAHHHRS